MDTPACRRGAPRLQRAASADAALIDGHDAELRECEQPSHAASADAALIDGHLRRGGVLLGYEAASADAALIDGHPSRLR